MAKWKINRSGPIWLMDSDGKLIGYRDSRGGEHLIPQISGVWGAADALTDVPDAGGSTSSTESLSGPRTITADDDQKQFTCITALTVTCPNGLSPRPSVIAVPPAAGNLTLTPTGGATLNGSASSITRTFANNRLGVAITPNPYDVNDYTVSGS